MRVVYAASKWNFGNVPSAIPVLHVRKPRLAIVAQMIASTEARLHLDPVLRALVQVQVARIHGCTGCEDLTPDACKKLIGSTRYAALSHFESSSSFSGQERAALALVDHATRARRVPPEVWERVKGLFTDEEVIELVWLNAAANYFSLQASMLGLESDGLADSDDQEGRRIKCRIR